MGQVSDLNDFTRSEDVIDPTACAWPAREIAAAEAPVTAGTDRYIDRKSTRLTPVTI